MYYKSFFKPVFDFCVALIILIILSPVLLIVMIFLAVSNRGTPFFTQLRPGKGGKIFRVIKFKTMNDQCDACGNLLPDEQRLTAVGKFIRKTSLDEIPQLLNVIMGNMSLIGPRPLLVEYLPLYSPKQNRRHEVRPGITGWAQVNGRNTISWQQKFEYDIWYVENLSALLDFRIFYLTLIKVFKAEGISGRGVATAEKFTGKN